jgi:glyoxylate reductase
MLQRADFVSLHAPLTPETHHLIDAAALAGMRPTAILVNTARGPLVDPAALAAALHAGTIAGAALDVTDPEPLPDDHPLWRAPGVLAITPHIGGNSPRANRQAAELAGDQLARFCAGQPLLNVVHQGQEPTP